MATSQNVKYAFLTNLQNNLSCALQQSTDGSLGTAPPHIQYVFWALTIFALWWGVTDLTSQGSALNAVQRQIEQQEAEAEMSKQSGEKVDNEGATKALDVPDIVTKRTISNVVSCVMVFAVYWIMVMKPGTLFWRPH